jgi:dimethylhistidine N-methyltransferase
MKWHQAHTTWFFETFVLRPFLNDYKPIREEFHWLFNSYYNSLGHEFPDKDLRSVFSRPSLDEVLAFRAHIDKEMGRILASGVDEEATRRIVLGLNHEQQHQELALTDIKHAFFSNPVCLSDMVGPLLDDNDHRVVKLTWHSFDGGLVEIGYPLRAETLLDFCFDNETPCHKVFLELLSTSNPMAVQRDSLGCLKGPVHMATYLESVELGHLASVDEHHALTCEVRRGLIARPRSLSPWMFYDAEGSHLFELITTLPEYYPTRTERAILKEYADAIVAGVHCGRSLPLRLVELGAGSASKTCILLEAALRLSDDVTYIPVDVCSNALVLACENVACALPEVRIEPIVRNYVTHPLQLKPFNGTTLALYIGASIGNFSPEEARLILRNLRDQLQTGDALFLGTDMVKDEPTLLAAYDDSDGITAAFNLNILHRLNRELGANFDAARFRHRVLWNSIESRIEMHLESTQEQDVRIEDANLDLHFTPHETIHTENSYKFTDRGIRSLLNASGFETKGAWKDSSGWYALTVACLR